MRKIMMGLGIALTALTLTLATPTTTEAKSKYVTAKQAGKKIASLQKRCYEKKIKSSTTFSFKAKNEDKAWDFVEKAYVETAKVQFGKGYGKGLNATCGTRESWKKSILTSSKGSFKFKLVINGKSKAYRKEYKDDECMKKLLIELKGFTKGKSQFDKAWITMCWFKARSCYASGQHKYTSNYDLYKRRFITDCDGLAGKYAFYAEQAGVKHVGVVSCDNHMWNWIKVDGKRYYIDYQDVATYSNRGRNIKEGIELDLDPLYHSQWITLSDLNDWYRENVDPNAEDVKICKNRWKSLTKEQKASFIKEHDCGDSGTMYEMTCSSYGQTKFLPLDAFCDYANTVYSKDWKHE